jgi:hypothetical protein
MDYIDVNTTPTPLVRGAYYLFEFGDADDYVAGITDDFTDEISANNVDITMGEFNRSSQYSTRYLGKFLVKYNNINEGFPDGFPTFIFYDVLPVNFDKIPILEEYDNGYVKEDRVLIYNYTENGNGHIPIRVYKASDTIIENIKKNTKEK